MKFFVKILVAGVACIITQQTVEAPAKAETSTQAPSTEQSPEAEISWVDGPKKVAITSNATIDLATGYSYLDQDNTTKLLTLSENPPIDGAYTVANHDATWWAIYTFMPLGYVRDDEKIDADAILKSLKENQIAGNEERKSAGLPEMYLDDWVVKPHYDKETHHLEWGIAHHDSKNIKGVNYTVRILGRTGVMNATLVTNAKDLDKDLADFRKATASFAYNPGSRYEQFQQGDKVATYGLAALITGGVAAAAVKTGAGKAALGAVAAFGKAIFAGIAALFVGLFGWIKNKIVKKD